MTPVNLYQLIDSKDIELDNLSAISWALQRCPLCLRGQQFQKALDLFVEALAA
jgi:hypothetical protein